METTSSTCAVLSITLLVSSCSAILDTGKYKFDSDYLPVTGIDASREAGSGGSSRDGEGGTSSIDSGLAGERAVGAGGMDAAKDATPDANRRDSTPDVRDAVVTEAGRDAGPDGYVDAKISGDAVIDANLGCANDTACIDQEYCNDNSHACVLRVATGNACMRDRQCAAGGGCCQNYCVSLSQETHCGTSGCGNVCTSDQYCDSHNSVACRPRLVNNGTYTCSRDRQCAAGGGCCDSVCTSLSQNNHCGSCAANCTAETTNRVCVDDGTPICRECNVDGDCATGKGCCNHVCLSLTRPDNCGVSGCGTNCAGQATNRVCVDDGTPGCGCNVDGDCATGEGCCNHVCSPFVQTDTQCGVTGCETNCTLGTSNRKCITGTPPHCGCENGGDCSAPTNQCDTVSSVCVAP
jgi:hypothetical protein